ncbi:MAG: FecR domain-containing protein [Armatimonadetes bacterium]|nr:FecR domain-containing protein [Armatimonadota bacterium]
MARIRHLSGSVRWRVSADAEWSSASLNLPVRQGAQIWIERKGRAELQFDDGSVLRLGSSALATLQVMYSDAEGTFTEIKLQEGLASLHLRHNKALYQIDTPFASLKAKGPAKIRIGVNNSVEFAVRDGEATVEGGHGSAIVKSGDFLRLTSATSNYKLYSTPQKDSWDYWNDDRDREMDDEGLPSRKYVPANVSYMSTELDQYGSWESDSTYGQVWCPRVGSSWRPYVDGQWVWVEPFGWTWVSNEPWGWTPYHYGTWVHRQYGWGWVPGARYQAWCPAPVHFCHYRDNVVWVPIDPSEIVYLSPSPYCRRMHDYFSITLAVAYSRDRDHCVARPYNSTYNNYVTNNFGGSSPRVGDYAADKLNNYTPRNMRNGAVSIAERDFGNRNTHNPFSHDQLNGGNLQYYNPARTAGKVVAGPSHIQPTAQSVTSMKVLERTVKPREETAVRPVYRTALPSRVETSLPTQTRERFKAEDRKAATQNAAITPSPRVEHDRTPALGRPVERDRTPALGRPTERTTQRDTTPDRNTDSAADIARRARESVGRTQPTTDTPRRTEVRSEAPRRDEPRRESPNTRDGERKRTEPTVPSREEPVRREEPKREQPRPVEREAPPARRTEQPRPVERQEQPRPVERRQEAPPPQRQEQPRPVERRQEAPPPQRQEQPRPVERRQEAPPPQRQDPPRRDRERGRP